MQIWPLKHISFIFNIDVNSKGLYLEILCMHTYVHVQVGLIFNTKTWHNPFFDPLKVEKTI